MTTSTPVLERSAVTRRRLVVRGIVQGVGFRPFVWRLANALALEGWVRNDAGGVTIEVQGPAASLGDFAARLRTEAPALARVDSVAAQDCTAETATNGFAILESAGGRAATAIGPDSAICADCLEELFTPTDRRYRYAFINCTHCGPRYTITRRLPYDRRSTSMAAFAQCPRCLAEYLSSAHRRFHAEPNACRACGPQLTLLDSVGKALACADPIADTLARIRRGGIVAIKGLGGFHLACDARDADAVARLRARKAREEKPFAVMVANVASVLPFAACNDAERALLASRARGLRFSG
jgi:hydrogenase maturation protein HypF